MLTTVLQTTVVPIVVVTVVSVKLMVIGVILVQNVVMSLKHRIFKNLKKNG